jgi:hypothetical protein
MGIFSFLRGNKHKSSIGSALSDFINAVIKASQICAKSMKPEIEQNTVNKEEMDEILINVYFEFFYFFMHHTNRILLGISNQDVMDRHLKMGGVYCAAAVKSIIGLSDKEMMKLSQANKEKMINLSQEILNKLDERECQYANSDRLYWDKDKPLDGIIGDSLLAKLTRNITIKCGYKMIDYNGVMVASNFVDNMIVQVKVSELFIKISKDINFESLVKALISEAG